jgi:hypothetical protein
MIFDKLIRVSNICLESTRAVTQRREAYYEKVKELK